MLGKVPDRRTNGAPCGVDARDEDQEARAEHVRLRYGFAVDRRREQIRDQIVLAGILLVLLDPIVQVLEDVRR